MGSLVFSFILAMMTRGPLCGDERGRLLTLCVVLASHVGLHTGAGLLHGCDPYCWHVP